jgi:hypothetical protein
MVSYGTVFQAGRAKSWHKPHVFKIGVSEKGKKKKKKGGKELRKQGKKSGKMSGMRQLIVAYKKPAPHFQRPE